jgi:dTDP-4-dehydrorhamnose reductase
MPPDMYVANRCHLFKGNGAAALRRDGPALSEAALMRFLVTGGSGFLGQRLMYRLAAHGEVLGTYFSRPARRLPFVPLDVTDAPQVWALIGHGGFDVCVHASGNRDLESCESDVAAAVQVNVDGARHVAQACGRAGTRLIYISTDHVFDGSPAFAYTEDDGPRPIQVYGFTKLAGEYEALKVPGSLAIRLPVLYGMRPTDAEKESFSIAAQRRLLAGQPVRADDSFVRYPVLVDDAADGVAQLMERGIAGVVHFSSEEGVTKYQWARLIATEFGFDPTLVVLQPPGGRAARPVNNRLSSNRLVSLGMPAPSPVTDVTRAAARSWAMV